MGKAVPSHGAVSSPARELSVTFEADEKEEFFDILAKRYYRANFGTMQKSEMDTLIFSFFYRKYRKQCQSAKKEPSDLEMAKMLGITPSRVAGLRLKADLMFPDAQAGDWKEMFSEAIKKARYDQRLDRIIISLADRLVFLEVKEAAEKAGGQPEYTLTPNLMQIAPEHLFMLLLELHGKDEAFVKEQMAIVLNNYGMSLDDLQGKTMPDKIKDFFRNHKKDLVCAGISAIASAAGVPPVLAAGLNAIIPLFGGGARQ